MTSPRILTVDLETSPLKVWTFSLFKPFIAINQIIEHTRVISWAAKWLDEDKVMFMSEYHHGRDVMLRRVHELLCEADIVVHFNGDSFDVPHLRREFKQAGLEPFSPFQSVDLYRQLKKAMYFPSYKLDYIAQALGVGAKVSHSGFNLWIHCLDESPADDPNRQKRAWNLMRKYNKGDVVVTEDLYRETLSYLPSHPHMGLYSDDPSADVCDRCTSTNLRNEGYAFTQTGKYQRYQCRDCGKWGRSKKAVAFAGGRSVAS